MIYLNENTGVLDTYIEDTKTGDPVTGATVTLTVTSEGGTVVLSAVAMTESGSGWYTYTVAYDTLTNNTRYTFKVVATKGTDVGTEILKYDVRDNETR